MDLNFLAFQWFGNLVTPSWWTDLWLNEGFASYVEYLGVEEVQPELRLLDQFVVMDLQVLDPPFFSLMETFTECVWDRCTGELTSDLNPCEAPGRDQ